VRLQELVRMPVRVERRRRPLRVLERVAKRNSDTRNLQVRLRAELLDIEQQRRVVCPVLRRKSGVGRRG
jgi:hypothetical protein